MNIYRSAVLASFVILICGCSSLSRNVSNLIFPPYSTSDQRKGELTIAKTEYCKEDVGNLQTEITKNEDGDVIGFTANAQGLAGTLAPLAAQAAFEQIDKFLKEEAERYKASYSAVVMGDRFFDGWGPLANINLKEIKVARYVDRGKTESALAGGIRTLDGMAAAMAPDAGLEKAMEATFKIVPTLDQTAFAIIPTSVSLNYSKAKVAFLDPLRPLGFDVLAPWTVLQNGGIKGFSPTRKNDVDLEIQLSLHGVWSDGRKQQNQLLGQRIIKLRNMKVGSTRKLNGRVVGDSYDPCVRDPNATLNLPIAELFPAVPRTVIVKNKLFGPGNFIVSILVSEVDDYGESVREIQEGVNEQRETVIESITNAL